MGFLLHIRSVLIQLQHPRDMLRVHHVLRFLLFKEPRRVDEQYVASRALFLQDDDTGRDSRIVKHVCRQTDHRIDRAVLQQLLPDRAFRSATEQHTVRKHDAHCPGRLQMIEAVKQERVVRL